MENRRLNGNALKFIAILAMTLDHFVWTISPGTPGYNYAWWAILAHIIGRITAPIMWFMVAEGYHHTRNVKTYALRLLAFALVSHLPYRFCFGHPLWFDGFLDQTSIGWPLLWGLLLLAFWESDRFRMWQKWLFLAFVLVVTLPSDWSAAPPLAILCIGLNRGSFRRQMAYMMLFAGIYSLGYLILVDTTYGLIQFCACLSIPLLALYDGKRGKARWVGKFMYLYYPAQLVFFGILRGILS